MKVDPYTSPLGDVALEILRTVRLDDVTERNLRDLAVGHSHVWADFYGPASSPGLARVLAHRFIDRQGCDELHLRAALVRFGGEQPPIAGDREAERSRSRWRQMKPFLVQPGPNEVLVGRCRRCGGWTMMHADRSSENWEGWGRRAQRKGDDVALEEYTGSLGPACVDSELAPNRRACLPPHLPNGCPDLDPNWTDVGGEPRGPVLCTSYPDCECGAAAVQRPR